MTTQQKIVLSGGTIAWFLIILRAWGKNDCTTINSLSGSCEIDMLIIIPLLAAFLFGIPTFILFKIWQKK